MGDQSRVAWVDAARGIGIFLVVFGHVWRGIAAAGLIPETGTFIAVDNAIYLFHMPLFFILSGMFFEKSAKRGGFAASLWKRSETLLYPLVLWSYITVLFLLAASSLTNRGHIGLWEALSYPFPPKDIYWFLGALFIIQTVAWFVVRIGSPLAYAAVFVLSTLALYTISLPEPLIWLASTLKNAPFFFVGLLLARMPLRAAPLALAGGAAFVAAEILVMTRPEIMGSAADFLPSLAASIGFVLAIAWIWPASTASSALLRFVPAIGQASMTIYVSHIIAQSGMRIVLMKLGVTSPAAHIVIGVAAGIGLPMAFHIATGRLGLRRLFGLGRDQARAV